MSAKIRHEGIDWPQNPYPDDVFIEPTIEQYALLHQALKKHSLTLDKFAGSISRRVWDICCKRWDELLREALASARAEGHATGFAEARERASIIVNETISNEFQCEKAVDEIRQMQPEQPKGGGE